MINTFFQDMLDAGFIVSFDDILSYSTTVEEHNRLVKGVLFRLQNSQLAAFVDNCESEVKKLKSLGYIALDAWLSMSYLMVRSVERWKTAETLKEVQRFIGFANFNRRFIEEFTSLFKLYTDLTSKVKPFL